MYYDAREFGAIGDGQTKNTGAIQKAIDECNGKGGGQVIIPPGIFVTGTLELKNNVELHLMSGSKLLGSPDRQDYTDKYNAPYDSGCKSEHATGMHLITAWKKENISISGNGVIDGNATAFMGPQEEVATCKPNINNWEYKGRWRPGQMVAFLECKSVKAEGVTFQNSTYWTIWPYACKDVLICNIKIRNDWRTPNGDGIDPDCCENVIISNCDILSGDDAIALRANRARSGLTNDLENVVITNCLLDTPLAGIRFGPSGEMSKIRNVTVSNCIIKNAGSGILFSQWYRPPSWINGVLIENIRISNMIINARAPLRMYVQKNCGGPCGFRDIHISNISATGISPCIMSGTEDCVFEDIYISDFKLSLKKLEDTMSNANDMEATGNVFHVKNVKNVSFRDLKIDVSSTEVKGLKNVMVFENVKKVELDDLDIVPGTNGEKKVLLKNVEVFEKTSCKIPDEDFMKLKTETGK